jgi:hypothetical protein
VIVLKVGVAENPFRLSVKEWFQEYLNLRYEGLEKYKPEKIQINNFTLGEMKGVRVERLRALPPTVGGCETIYIPNQLGVYSIGFCQNETFYADWSSENAVKEKILSSFKLIKK